MDRETQPQTTNQNPDVPTRFLLLDTLRGYAAVAIMIYHFPEIRLHASTYLAVDYFIILSGFVLSHAYFSRPGLDLRQFVVARFARLYPLHLVTFLMFLWIYQMRDMPIDKSAAALHGLMIHNIGFGPDRNEFNAPSWSISVEFWVNVGAAIAIVSLLPPLRRLARLSLLLGVAYAIYVVFAIFHGSMNASHENLLPLVSLALLRGGADFAVGMAVYEFYLLARPKIGSAEKQLIGILTVACLVAFVVGLALPIRETPVDFLFIPLFAAVVFLCAFEVGATATALKKFSYFGTISFAIYLLHRPVMDSVDMLLGADAPLIARMALSLLVVFPLSCLVHHVFERPAYHFLRQALTARRNQGSLMRQGIGRGRE